MNEHLFHLQCQLSEILIEMEAMKIANIERERHGESPAYGEDSFRLLIGQIAVIRVRIG